MLTEAREIMPDLKKEARPFDPLTRLAEFSERFPRAMRILRIGGVHPTKDVEMINPYTGKPHSESFTNIGEHCLAVASLADTLALKLHEKGILSAEEVASITNRALVHDAPKRIEIMRRHAVEEGVVDDAYPPEAYETIKPILEAEGIDQELIDYMFHAGEGTGHLSIGGFLMLDDGIPTLVPGKMAEKIFHLADDMTTTSIPLPGEKPLTVYLTPGEKMVAANFPRRHPFYWKEGLAFNMQGEVVAVSDIKTCDRSLRWIRPYAYWQLFVSDAICREIQAVLDPASQRKPEYFVKDLAPSTP